MGGWRPRFWRKSQRCWAYTAGGTICGEPAVTVDLYRGFAVCEQHAIWVCTNCETANSVAVEVCEDCGMPRELSETPLKE